MEADKFSVQLPHSRIRVASESPELRTFLEDDGFSINQTLGTTGMLLGQPSDGKGIGRPLWVLYESNSVVLRRSLDVKDTFDAASYHLRSVQAAADATDRLALLSRVTVLPSGRVWLTDPFVRWTMPGLDRVLLRSGVIVLPTTVASLDVATGEVVLPDHRRDLAVPSGRLVVDRMLYRSIPEMAIDGAEHLRLARSVVQTASTDLERTVAQIVTALDQAVLPLELLTPTDIESALDELVASTR